MVNFNNQFETDMEKIKTLHENYKIFVHTGKLLNGNVQIVLASDNKYVDEMNEIAKNVKLILNSCKYNNILNKITNYYR